MASWQAIAAMARNRVIGIDNKLPWHLSEDFKWFKKKTMGHTLIMGRKTYESIGKPLPGRDTIVLTRSNNTISGVRLCHSIEAIAEMPIQGDIYFCGGAQIYEQVLPYCSDLFLTLVNAEPEGDTYFPDFENHYEPAETIEHQADFSILHYHNNTPLPFNSKDL